MDTSFIDSNSVRLSNGQDSAGGTISSELISNLITDAHWARIIIKY